MREDEKPRRYPNGHFTFRHETADGETSTRTIPYSDVTLNQLVEELEMFINGLGYSPIHLEWEYVSERAEREKNEEVEREEVQNDIDTVGESEDDDFDL